MIIVKHVSGHEFKYHGNIEVQFDDVMIRVKGDFRSVANEINIDSTYFDLFWRVEIESIKGVNEHGRSR